MSLKSGDFPCNKKASSTKGFVLVLCVILSVLAVSSVSTDVSDPEESEGDSAFEKPEWGDKPSYVEDLESEIVNSDNIQERRSRERCSEHINKTYDNGTEYRECNETETYFYGTNSMYLFDLKNVETQYVGDGEIYLAFTASPNDLVKNLHLEDKNPNWDEDTYVEWFNEDYLYNGENLTKENFSEIEALAEDVSASSLDGSVKGSRIESQNLMSNSGRYEFIIELEDFRSGTVALNDAVGVRLKSDAYNGGGETL